MPSSLAAQIRFRYSFIGTRIVVSQFYNACLRAGSVMGEEEMHEATRDLVGSASSFRQATSSCIPTSVPLHADLDVATTLTSPESIRAAREQSRGTCSLYARQQRCETWA